MGELNVAEIIDAGGPLRIVVNQYLTQAIIDGDTLIVSPAMRDLMKHADEQEMRRLLSAIKPVRFPFKSCFTLSPFALPPPH